MKHLVLTLLLFSLVQNFFAGDFMFSVRGNKTYVNDQEILVAGLRCSNEIPGIRWWLEALKEMRGEYIAEFVTKAWN